jgi:cysteinyl-tRNA synthetase
VLRLHDTALGQVLPLEPARPGRLSLYVCGPTVYDVPHIGHGRQVLVYDVLRRYLAHRGVEVTHVSNITDIDDHIINRANEEGRAPAEVAEHYEATYWDAVDRLGVLRPHHTPHATEYVTDMVDLIRQLEDRGIAYPTDDGVYFAAEEVPDYGLLAQQKLENLRAGARVETKDQKRSPVDFALWKLSKPGEPSWPSPWGPGRPGWHTECVVMSLDLLGEGFDLHTGGLDLKFPHHENERAQAEALGRPFARRWMHHAFVEVAGEKMSKSLGNFTTLTELLARHDGRAYRMLALRSHYRTPIEVTPEGIAANEAALRRYDDLALRLPIAFAGDDDAAAAPVPDEAVLARFNEAMDDDLDTPAAMSVLSEAIRAANAAADAGEHEQASRLAAAVATVGATLGITPRRPGADSVPADVVERVARMDEARRSRDFATADALRAELSAEGWLVENAAGGSRVRRA